MVMFGHLIKLNGMQEHSGNTVMLINWGNEAVIVFFLLSGTVIEERRQETEGINWMGIQFPTQFKTTTAEYSKVGELDPLLPSVARRLDKRACGSTSCLLSSVSCLLVKLGENVLPGFVYVLHAFQNKTQKTSKQDIQIGQQRYTQMIQYRQDQQGRHSDEGR